MSHAETLGLIRDLLAEMSLAKGRELKALSEEDQLLDGSLGIDSLDLAALVVQLQQRTCHDPFAGGFITFHTVGELASLFSQSHP